MGTRAGAALMLLLPLASAGAATGLPLRLCYEDVPQAPWSMADGSGLNIELLRRVEQQLGENFVFMPMPWKRCLQEARWGTVDAVVGSADTPERRTEGELPTGTDGRSDPTAALYVESYNVFIRTGSGASWNGKSFVVPHGSIIVPRGYVIAQQLRDDGYPVREAIKSADEGLRILADGAADVAVLFGLESENLARTPRFKDKVKEVSPAYLKLPFYLLASHDSYQRDPQRFEAIWNGIRQVRTSADYQRLLDAAIRRSRPHPADPQ